MKDDALHLVNGTVVHKVKDGITRYCGDERLELDTHLADEVHMVFGTSDYPSWVQFW